MPREPIVSHLDVVLGDDWTDAATFQCGLILKLDTQVYSGNALAQLFNLVQDEWQPVAGMALRKGFASSLPDISGDDGAFPGGATAVRFKRATTGVASTLDVRIWVAT